MILKVLDWARWDDKNPKEPQDWERFEGDHIKTTVVTRKSALESFRSASQHDNPFVHLLIAVKGRMDVNMHVVFSGTGAHMVYAEATQAYIIENGKTVDRV